VQQCVAVGVGEVVKVGEPVVEQVVAA